MERNPLDVLLEGWVSGGGLYESFGVVVADYQGNPIPDVEVKFERAPIVPGATLPPGIILPERVVTNSFGVAFSGLVMDVAGEQKVIASLPEFQSIAPLEFQAQCNNLADLVSPYNPDDMNEIVERALPLVSIVKAGNGQIGSNGKKLSVNLTVEMRNRFGEVPITPAQASALLKGWYDRHWSGKEIVVTGVEVIVGTNAYFEVMEGNASLQKPSILPAVTKAATQEKRENENVLEIKSNMVIKSPKEKAPVKQKTTQIKATTSNVISYPIGNQGEYSAELVFGENQINPVTIHAGTPGSLTVRLTYIDNNPSGGMTISDVPRPDYEYSVMPTYFFIGPPEVYFSQETGPGTNTYLRTDTLSTWDPFEVPFSDAQSSYIEARLPLDEPLTTTGGIENFDACRQKITSIPGTIASVSLSDLPLERKETVNGRYHVYRTQQPISYVSRVIAEGDTPPTLPPGFTYVQMKPDGFARPFAMADEQRFGDKKPQDLVFPKFCVVTTDLEKYYYPDYKDKETGKNKRIFFMVWNRDDDNANGVLDYKEGNYNDKDIVPLIFSANRGNCIVYIEVPTECRDKINLYTLDDLGRPVKLNYPIPPWETPTSFSKILFVEGIKGSDQIGDVKLRL